MKIFYFILIAVFSISIQTYEMSYGDSSELTIHKSPMQQFNDGIIFNKIVCKTDFILIQKYDGSPACVKPETKEKLIEREWTERLPPEIDLHTDERIAREVGYLGVMMSLPYMEQHETIAISLKGRTNLVLPMVDYYYIEILSNKTALNDSFSNISGKMRKVDLQRFFEENPMNHFAKHGLLFSSLGGYTDDTDTYGLFNRFLTHAEELKIGAILQYYENKRTNNEATNWSKIIEWPTGKISDKYFSEFVENTNEDNAFAAPQISQNDLSCYTSWDSTYSGNMGALTTTLNVTV